MAKLAQLRKQAQKLGMPASDIRNARTAEDLEQAIADFEGNGSSTPAKKRAVVKKAVAKKSAGKSAPAKPKATAKRPTTAKAKASNGNGGRNVLGTIDWNNSDGWNARSGSAPDRIVKALRKFKGDRAKTFDFLSDDMWDFVGKKMRDGSKRTKADAEAMLRYRIARTAWDFAMQTGQHEKSENRATYGTAGTGSGAYKATKSPRKASKATAKAKPTPKAKKAPKAAEAPKRRGRPPGSKNKVKV
jgi:hypothetical protein